MASRTFEMYDHCNDVFLFFKVQDWGPEEIEEREPIKITPHALPNLENPGVHLANLLAAAAHAAMENIPFNLKKRYIKGQQRLV